MSTQAGARGPHVIVLGNEKGGSGKSTTAVHIALALASVGLRVAVADCDWRQRTTARYLENRAQWAQRKKLDLIVPPVTVIEDGQDAALAEFLKTDADVLVIDTPGRDSDIGRAAIARADTLITPINDSFIDFDLLGQVDPEKYNVTKPSFYAELVWKARQTRARSDGGTVDWVVLRNRLSTLEARNRKRVGTALEELSRRIGFRVVPGLSERVIYRELFPRGLTLLDIAHLKDASVSHVAARAELRELIGALQLPLADRVPGQKAA
ncbi:division plane positioning ATPase MipZ [Sandaracinobacteroides sp. A072]|uniref:division plane positioning ATPase MipZ n=1 Tax=Sandaracinobacteroides sp. A072 TaxID=3461146 RepID=UPI004041AE6B